MHYSFALLAILSFCIFIYITAEFLIIKYNGTRVFVPDIPRLPYVFGTGPQLTYVVMGDSTAIGQGAEYEHGYALTSVKHLAKKHTVTFINTGISGARMRDVASNQLGQVIKLKPGLVLLGVGGNDTTHFTNLKKLQTSLQYVIDSLKEANPDVRIVATRSPALDSVSRFPPASKYILRLRTERVNNALDSVIKTSGVIPAFIAEKTRAAFLADTNLTAADNFHPNEQGYELWTPIINEALDKALDNKPQLN